MRDNISHLIKNGSPDVSFTDFAYLHNSIQRDVAKGKTNYFRSKLDENMGQPKKLYLKNLGYSSKSKSKAKIVFNVDGTLQSDTYTYTVCNHVNKFLLVLPKIWLTNYPMSAMSTELRQILSRGFTRVKVLRSMNLSWRLLMKISFMKSWQAWTSIKPLVLTILLLGSWEMALNNLLP